MRHLMRDYVLIMANTGMRHGTEALNLKWKHVTLFEEKDLQYSGDERVRQNWATGYHLQQSAPSTTSSASMSAVTTSSTYRLKTSQATSDLPVFRLPDGTVSKNIHQTFRKFVTDTGLITCPRTGQNRTLYSLRHTYATFALLNDGMDIHALAVQMGTSIGMIERHYSHLTPRLKKDMLTGKRYELSREAYQEKALK